MTATPASTFETFPCRVHGELEQRKAMAARALSYHHAFLDDCIRAILPHDLILIGAPSGVGKSDLALMIASSNALVGKRVHYLALEAEPVEMERRTKFALLSRRAYHERHINREDLNYADWLLAKCEHIVGDWNAWADQQILESLNSLRSLYRGAKFGLPELKAAIEDASKTTDLIVVDHLHYVDLDDDENENRALGGLAKMIRDLALLHGVPVILVSHLRKRDQRTKQIVATMDDFHGSSNIVKNATQIISIDRADTIEASKWYLAPTYMSVLKDRRIGARPLVAVVDFDLRTKKYASTYTLGRLVKGSTEWNALQAGDEPRWAQRHRPLNGTTAPNQTEIDEQERRHP